MPTPTSRPRNALFKILRDLWLSVEPGRTSVQLAERLGTRKQLISMFATGSGERVPKWPMILSLLDELGLELRVCAGGIVVTRARRGPDGGIATRKDDVTIDFPADGLQFSL